MTVIERCKSCGAPIRFVRWKTSGRWAPLDAEPQPTDGNVVIERERGMDRAVLFNAASPVHQQLTRYRSHFSTCPNAKQHRHTRQTLRSA